MIHFLIKNEPILLKKIGISVFFNEKNWFLLKNLMIFSFFNKEWTKKIGISVFFNEKIDYRFFFNKTDFFFNKWNDFC